MQNFRSYKIGKLELCAGINGIIGSPQSGKTNIIRAIKLLAFNRPSGFKFVRNRSSKLSACIKIKVDNYRRPIVMRKGIRKTFYRIGSEKFEKFGKSVPEKISEILNLSEINFHEQLESPFLITSKPSEVSQAINEVTGITDFDSWIDIVNDKIRQLKRNQFFAETARADAKKALQTLAGLKGAEKTFKRIKEVEKELSEKSRRYEFASEKLAFIRDLKERISKDKKITSLEKDLVEAKKINERIEKIQKIYLLKKALLEIKAIHSRALKEFISFIRIIKKCPTCFGKISRINIARIKNEFSLDK